MKSLERNKREIFYSNYLSKSPILDTDGNETGEYQITYSVPTSIRCHVTPNAGQVVLQEFGNELVYDRVLLVDFPNCPIDENSILYVDVLPTTGKHDYIVKSVSRNFNYTRIAIAKVAVS